MASMDGKGGNPPSHRQGESIAGVNFKVIGFDPVFTDESILEPATDQRETGGCVGANAQVDLAARGCRDREIEGVQGDFTIGVDGAGITQTEDVFRFLEGFFDAEGVKEAMIFLEGSLQADNGEFTGSAVDALGVVGVDFLVKDFSSFTNFCDSFSRANAHQMVLQPPIGTFDLALGLGRKRVSHINAQIGEHRLPLHGCGRFGLLGLLPHGVAPFDEPENRMIIDVVAMRTTMLSGDVFHGADVGETTFLTPEITVKQTPAVIINARN